MYKYFNFPALIAQFSASRPDGHLYCLADHGGMPGLQARLDMSKRPWRSLFGGRREQSSLAVAPLLFCLAAPGVGVPRQTLDWLAQHGTYSSTIVLVESPLSIDELARRLALRLDAQISDQMDVLLRFFDPRIFEQLARILTSEQKQHFFDVGKRWWFFDHRGTLQEVETAYAEVSSFKPPLVLTAEQEFALLDASEPDQVDAQLKENIPNLYIGVPIPERHDFIRQHSAAAKRYGIVATHELTLYCATVLMYGEGFADVQPWKALLEQVRTGKVAFVDAVARIDPESLKRLEAMK
ncbi:DUF4123 domain-containing protein [Massilia antarctica]|uniref:DUF4123 domain-containing protein n=1 Tax=Massilia antarctica TaxID=2765360 RepID=UPI0006BB8563|nr:DUF4123 domain-containing protein [Massilia sp. H27-R4]MCY0912615.1 DUF4123 domain-containing protein [Massilia sp. H27-R4]CUI03676.1 hypothetical protein BN2497_2129 [Janthinobacterium sp. CG23_2]CUU27462.1 hypothetical protein BN3177_2129 [Janthinobacterium sp. CG23_2]